MSKRFATGPALFQRGFSTATVAAMADPPLDVAVPAVALAFGPFTYDAAKHRLSREGEALALQPRPFALLGHLLAHPGRLLTKDELLDAVWGHRHVGDAALKVAMAALRAALGDDSAAPRYIETVPRMGYRFIAAVDAPPAATERLPAAALQATSAALADQPAPGKRNTRHGNLPAPLPGLIGRQAELDALASVLRTERLVTVVGPAGVGKTRLALAALARHAAAEPPADGAWLLRLDALVDIAALPLTVARTLALAASAGHDDASLCMALAPMQAWLLLDNAEHLAGPLAPSIEGWLAAAPGLRILVTSQVPLHLPHEQRLPLAPLTPPPEDADADTAAANAACQLFVAHVRRLKPDFQRSPSPDSARTTRDIVVLCRMLDGLPLALELAAARVPLLGTAGVRAAMHDRFALLTRGAAGSDARHRTLRAALEWSYDLLTDDERRVLRRLAVFANGFTPTLAVAVATDPAEPDEADDDVLNLADSLRERSLLVADTGSSGAPRWRLLESVRHFALERLRGAGEELATRDRHAQAIHALFADADRLYVQQPMQPWLRALRPEADDLRAALEHTRVQAQAQPGGRHETRLLELFAHAVMFWSRAGRKGEALQWHEVVQPLIPKAGHEALQARLALARETLAVMAQRLAPDEVWPEVAPAITWFEANDEPERALLGLYQQIHLATRLQRPIDVVAQVQRMRALERPGWSGRARSFATWAEALEAYVAADAPRYARLCRTELERAQADADESSAWLAAYGLAQALWIGGACDEAIDVIEPTVAAMREAQCLRENSHQAALACSLRLGRDASPATVALARETADLLRSEGLLWTLGDALSLLPARQGRWPEALAVKAWTNHEVARRNERRGEPAGGLHRLFARLREEARVDEGLALPLPGSEAELLRLVFGPPSD